jgi:ABC-type Fe3+ transport system substrate-binding protein
LLAANNLSDVANAATARSNLSAAASGANTDITSLALGDGSSGAPALANTGDTNTGIFFPGADTVGVAVGGTEVWRYGSNPTTAKNLIINGAFVYEAGYQTG